jgi:Ca2+-binding RTX toxin-like protein
LGPVQRFYSRAVVFSAVLAVAVGLLATPASATFVCKNLSGVVNVHMQPAFDKATMYLNASEALKLNVDGVIHDCGKTASQSFSVQVNPSTGADNFGIDISRTGAFYPHDVFFDVNLGDGNDTMRVLGDSGSDRIYANTLTQGPNSFQVIDTNGDGNPNVDLTGVNRINLTSFGGNDHLGVSGSGYSQVLGPFTLTPVKLPLVMNAAGGKDELRGGTKGDTALGGGGNDDAKGGSGGDLLKGGSGDDRLDGDAGTDTCKGGPGSDTTVQCEKGSP